MILTHISIIHYSGMYTSSYTYSRVQVRAILFSLSDLLNIQCRWLWMYEVNLYMYITKVNDRKGMYNTCILKTKLNDNNTIRKTN